MWIWSAKDFQEFSQFPYLGLDVTERDDNVDAQLPQCETGCTASMLGLHPVTKNQLLNLLKASIYIFI